MSILRKLGLGRPGSMTRAFVPDGQRVYAIGDIHGRFDLLTKMNSLISEDLASYPIDDSVEVYLGDYTDRGADSRAVLEHLSSAPSVCSRRICLKGNHDEIFLRFLHDAAVLSDWRGLGGLETLFSYGIQPPMTRDDASSEHCHKLFVDAVPPRHVQFLQQLPLTTEIGSYFFVHAGLRPDLPKDMQDDSDLLWIREPFLSSRRDHGCIVVHGHTPREDYESLDNRINVDTGAYLSGRLTCVVLEGEDRRFLQAVQ